MFHPGDDGHIGGAAKEGQVRDEARIPLLPSVDYVALHVGGPVGSPVGIPVGSRRPVVSRSRRKLP